MQLTQHRTNCSSAYSSANSWRLPYVLLLLVLFLALVVQWLPQLSRPPTGYLHSWNQITTLATVRAISHDLRNLLQPRDVVVPISWDGIRQALPSAIPDGFPVYEEFPLYHLLSALLARSGVSVEVSSRLVSLVFWVLGGICLFALARVGSKDPFLPMVCAAIYLSSFPLAYFGQAIMSDVAMLACVSLGFLWWARYSQQGSAYDLALAALSIAVAALFKSYAAVFALIFITPRSFSQEVWLRIDRRLLVRVLLIAAVLTPVVSWHVYSAFQFGDHDLLSHSVHEKIRVIFSLKLYLTLIKMWFQYFGYAVGAAVVLFYIAGAASRYVRRWSHSDWYEVESPPAWVKQWLCCVLLYAILTADKLPFHSYYFLLAFPPLVYLSAMALAKITTLVGSRYGQRSSFMFFACLLLLNGGFAGMSLAKALKPNPDVEVCAAEISSLTQQSDLIAVLTDVSRYNSINYYANRLGLYVEGDQYALQRYRDLGARYLLINLEPATYASLRPWLDRELRQAKPLWLNEQVSDFKGKKRVAAVYVLK